MTDLPERGWVSLVPDSVPQEHAGLSNREPMFGYEQHVYWRNAAELLLLPRVFLFSGHNLRCPELLLIATVLSGHIAEGR